MNMNRLDQQLYILVVYTISPTGNRGIMLNWLLSNDHECTGYSDYVDGFCNRACLYGNDRNSSCMAARAARNSSCMTARAAELKLFHHTLEGSIPRHWNVGDNESQMTIRHRWRSSPKVNTS
jgi:hypothetical protein